MSLPEPLREVFHRLVAELTSDYAWGARVDESGRPVVEIITEGYTRLFGYSLAEMRQVGWTAVVHPDEHAHVRDATRRALAGETVRGELRHVRRDGSLCWLSYVTRPLLDEQGRVVALVGASQDITERKLAEEELQRQAALLGAILAQTPTGILAVDGEGRLILANDLVRRVTGQDFAIGQHFASYVPAPFIGVDREGRQLGPHDWPVARSLLRGEVVRDEEIELRRDDGGVVHIRVDSTPLYGADGGLLGVVTAFVESGARRATEEAQRRRVEELAEQDRRKDEFLATLAHELRNPLAPIRAAASVLGRVGPPSPEATHAREVIDRQVQQMSRLLDDLLDVSRFTLNRLELRRSPVELRAVLDAALETSQPLIEAGRHALSISLPAAPIRLDADLVRLAQVFSNLLGNAAKYTDPGGRISLIAAREGDAVVVSVRDTGIGISAEMLPRVFELFSQAAPARERSQGGLGIGLSLVRGLVALHGGSVSVRSEGPGRGSEFVVRLPTLSEADATASPEPATPAPEARPGPGRRVLVVDDNRDGADTLSMLLEMMDHEVRTAYDGPTALALAEEFRPDVALLDIGLPGLSGLEVAREIRARPWGARVFLVAMTGWGQEDDRRRSREAGFDHHLVKPADPAAIAALLAARGG